MDFDKLNSNITSTINNALDEVHKHLNEGRNFGKTYENRQSDNKSYQHGQSQGQQSVTRTNQDRQYQNQVYNNKPYYNEQSGKQFVKNINKKLPISMSPPGTVSGVLYIVFGSIGLGISSLLFFSSVIVDAVASRFGWLTTLSFTVYLPSILISLCLLMKGISL